ncbi:tRNA pseudouridine(38-40) synthase TruA [Brumimicrobium aurantiacum]|uniref:tRNA pseudouridine synthase A n=1 Tax=Brumimicrobium aurantiacum TaxID=1737063 RepID=A0A3E1EZS8_9FLAO|nr:tRNA pseudouridine(38-40) synthase TruA [Brumimicrobium aurantiacum]RFC55058.1 tRNA pseudouridine(38-40) synthase TruA [Brumimicrobium aurantiacum]
MKKRLFFRCAYDGTHYSGWQKQPNAKTIQGEIEEKLSRLFGNQSVDIVGCGRTDAGVHASQSYFHADLPTNFAPDQLRYKLNNMLPLDIAINEIVEVAEDAHARFDATRRTYYYFLHQHKLPFHQNDSWYYPRKLDVEKMNEATQFLLGRQDFTSFSKLHTDVNNNFCDISFAEWKHVGDQLRFEIRANRFLRNMVRAIVGTLLEVGNGSIAPEEVRNIIAKEDRGAAGCSVPAKGLFLQKIKYPYL